MSEPTTSIREHYNKLKGRKIKDVLWGEDPTTGEPYPLLLLSRLPSDPKTGEAAIDIPVAVVSKDPEGNGAGFLNHNLQGGGS